MPVGKWALKEDIFGCSSYVLQHDCATLLQSISAAQFSHPTHSRVRSQQGLWWCPPALTFVYNQTKAKKREEKRRKEKEAKGKKERRGKGKADSPHLCQCTLVPCIWWLPPADNAKCELVVSSVLCTLTPASVISFFVTYRIHDWHYTPAKHMFLNKCWFWHASPHRIADWHVSSAQYIGNTLLGDKRPYLDEGSMRELGQASGNLRFTTARGTCNARNCWQMWA